MNEMMLSGIKKESSPTGPGPSELIGGDHNAGFFGEVLSSDIITGDMLASKLDVTQGVAINSSTAWLKFIIDGKVVFTPKTPIRKAISWEHLYSKGIVYGTEDNGLFPLGVPTFQNTKININGFSFIVRLMSGAEVDPTSQPDNKEHNNIADKTEWDRLYIPITNGDWFNYSQLALGVGTTDGDSVWVKESALSNNTYKVQRGGAGLIGSFVTRSGSDTNVARAWKPLLELVGHAFNGITGLHYTTEYVGSPRLDDWNYTD